MSDEDRKEKFPLARLILSILFISGYFALLFMIFGGVVVVDVGMKDIANILLGIMSASLNTVVTYWFKSGK